MESPEYRNGKVQKRLRDRLRDGELESAGERVRVKHDFWQMREESSRLQVQKLLAKGWFEAQALTTLLGVGDGRPHQGFEADLIADFQLLIGAVSEYMVGVVKATDPAVEDHSENALG